jgi:PST family polysaccharide transporter
MKKNRIIDKVFGLFSKSQPGLRKLVGNTAWLLADKVVRMGVALFVGVWVARYLGPEQFGLYNYALALVGLFSVFASLGLNSIVVRDLVRNPVAQGETMGTAFVLKLFGSSATCFLTVATALMLRPDNTQTSLFVAVIAVGTIFESFGIIDFWYQARVESKYPVFSKLISYLLINVVKIILLTIKAPLIAFCLVWTGERALEAFGLVICYHIQGNLITGWRWSVQRAKVLLRESWPLILSGIVVMIYMRIDQIMLGDMVGEEAVGIYSAAVKIAEMWYLIPLSIVSSTFPSIVKAKEISQKLYYERLQKLFSLLAALSYSIAIPITLFSTQIVTLLYGEGYIESGSVLSVQIWAGLFVSLGLARGPWLITEGFTKFSAATTATGAGVNVVLNYFLIPIYGPIGASIATVISQMVASYLSHAFYPKTRIMFIQQSKSLILMGLFDKKGFNENE